MERFVLAEKAQRGGDGSGAEEDGHGNDQSDDHAAQVWGTDVRERGETRREETHRHHRLQEHDERYPGTRRQAQQHGHDAGGQEDSSHGQLLAEPVHRLAGQPTGNSPTGVGLNAVN